MNSIPTNLYSAETTRKLDQVAIEEFGIPGYELMAKAGKCVFDLMQQHFPLAKRLLICCGAGNNAGDGYVVARLAQQAGLDVDVVSMVDPNTLQGDALQAYKDWHSLGYQLTKFEEDKLNAIDLVIDALLGTGLQRKVEGEWREIIEAINKHKAPVVAIDIPSGLSADTGAVMGAAIVAYMTVSFIGMKKGLFTADALDHCGKLYFDTLDVPEQVYTRVEPEAKRLELDELKKYLKPRKKNSHKGSHGHVLVVGGDHGMVGAVRMAGESALRAGAGLVSVVTRCDHVIAIVSGRPELMVWSVESHIPAELLNKADCIVVGPGLGQQSWGKQLLQQVLEAKCPKVVDADALNMLDAEERSDDWVLTPHPGEAARLLSENTRVIQNSRFTAADMLQQMYGGVIVLKGAGSIVKSANDVPSVCPFGNPGMAVAGMGDVLSGVIAALIVQGLDLKLAAELGVLIHSRAGDLAAQQGERGLLASDLFDSIRQLVNPE